MFYLTRTGSALVESHDPISISAPKFRTATFKTKYTTGVQSLLKSF